MLYGLSRREGFLALTLPVVIKAFFILYPLCTTYTKLYRDTLTDAHERVILHKTFDNTRMNNKTPKVSSSADLNIKKLIIAINVNIFKLRIPPVVFGVLRSY